MSNKPVNALILQAEGGFYRRALSTATTIAVHADTIVVSDAAGTFTFPRADYVPPPPPPPAPAPVPPVVTPPVPPPVTPPPQPAGGATAALTVVSAFDQRRVFQRDTYTGNPPGFSTTFNKGWGAVSVVVKPSANSTSGLFVRLHDALDPAATTASGTGAVIQPAVHVAGVTNLSSTSNNAVTLTIPAAKVWYYADLALDAAMTNPVRIPSVFGVGSVAVFTGTSHAAGIASDYAYSATGKTVPNIATMVPISPFGVCFAPYETNMPSNAWLPVQDGTSYNSAFAAEYLRLSVAQLGVVCALIGKGMAGCSVQDWNTGDLNAMGALGRQYGYLNDVLNHCDHKFETFLTMLGHNDAGKFHQDQTTHRLLDLGAALDAVNPMPYNWVSSDVAMWQGSNISSAYRHYILSSVRVAEQRPRTMATYWQDAGGYGVGGHSSMLGRMRAARIYYRYAMMLLGPAKGGLPLHQGPRFTGTATRVGRVIDLDVAQDGGTTLIAYGWTEGDPQKATAYVEYAPKNVNLRALAQVYPAGKANLSAPKYALDATNPVQIISPTKIRVTLAADPGDNTRLDFWWQGDTDAGDAQAAGGMVDVKDDVTDSDGVPYGRSLRSTYDPICIPPPAPDAQTIAVNAPAATAAGAWIVMSAPAGTGLALPGAGGDAYTSKQVEVAIGGGPYVVPDGLMVLGDNSWSGYVRAPSPPSAGLTIIVRRAGQTSPDATSTVDILSARNTLPPTMRADASVMYDVLNVGTLWQDAAKTIPATHDAPVRCWADALGNAGNDLVQADPDPRLAPYLLWREMRNGPISAGWDRRDWDRPSLIFDSTSVWQVGGRLLGAFNAPFASAVTGDFTCLMVVGTGYFAGASLFAVGNATTGAPAWRNSGKQKIEFSAPGAAMQVTRTGASAAVGASKNIRGSMYMDSVVVRYTAADGVLKLYAQSQASEAVSGVATDLAAVTFNSVITGSFGGSKPGFGTMRQHEIVWFNRAVTDAERDALVAYSVAKWGVG